MSIRIAAGPSHSFEELILDAAVLEDDTHGVLAAERFAKERYEDVGQLLERAVDAEPEPPGRAVVRGVAPLAIHAIVHDLAREPTWREEWIVDALYGIFEEAERRKLRSLAMPMLGTLLGTLDPRRFIQLFHSALSRTRFEQLELIRLVVPEGSDPGILDPLREFELEVRLGP